jgi:hypothetical protein
VLAGLGGFALYQKSQAERATFVAECREMAAAGNARTPLPKGLSADQLRLVLRKIIACTEDAGGKVDDELKRKAGLL